MKKSVFWVPLLSIVALLFSGCSHQLESGLSEYDAQQVAVLLRVNGIHASIELDPAAKKDTPSWIVKVRGQNETVIRAWKVLQENGMPREKVKGLDEVFANAGMIPTASEEKARFLAGLNGELTKTLHSLPGVVDARVEVVLPEKDPLLEKDQQVPPTASALIQYRGDQPPLKDVEIRSLIAKGVEGLSPDNVVIVTKKVESLPIPESGFGPFSWNAWLEVAALSLAAVAGLVALLVLSLSQKRKYKIKALEKQLAQLREQGSSTAVVKA